MADAGANALAHPPRSERVIERLKTTAGVLAALAGAVTGMWTVYEKVRTDARQYTATSYDVLAPQMNQLTEAVRKLEQENQQLKAALVSHAERPRPLTRPRAGAAGAASGASATSGTSATTPAKPGEPAGAAAGTTTGPGTAQGHEAAQQEQPDDALGRILGTVQQTRQAVESVRKVPETFQKVLDSKGKK
jgi:hypothetical protein